MKKLLIVLVVGFMAGLCFAKEEPKGKYALILQAGNETNEGRARAAHALLYATELLEGGYEVVLIFDGAGTGWANELRKPENPLHGDYLNIQELGIVEEICDHCSEEFDVKKKLSERQKASLSGDYKGHPSLVKWLEMGYQILVL